MNGAFFILIALLLAVAPVPIGSNRPFFWEVNAALVGTLAFVYLGLLASQPDRLRLPLREFLWPALLAGISLVWMIIQLLPLPFEFFAPRVWTDGSAALGVELGRRITMDVSATATMALNYVTYGLLFFLSAQINVNETRAHRFMQALYWIVVAHAGIAIILLFQLEDTLLFIQKWTYQGVATGFFVNRNSFATFLAFGLAIGSSLLVNAVIPRQQSTQNRPLREILRIDKVLIAMAGYGAGLAIIGSALLLTASRMGALVGAIGLLMPVMLVALRFPGRRAAALAVGMLLALLILFLVLLSAGGLIDRFGSQEALQDLRWPLFEQTLGMIAARPFSGFGGGTYQDAFAIYHRLPLSADVTWDRAHNLYLELFADLGIFALGVMAAFVYVLWRIARKLNRQSLTVAPVAAITVAAIALLHSVVDFSLQIQAIVLMFVAVLGAGYAQSIGGEKGRRRSAAAPEPLAGRMVPTRPSAGPFAAQPRGVTPVTRPTFDGSPAMPHSGRAVVAEGWGD